MASAARRRRSRANACVVDTTCGSAGPSLRIDGVKTRSEGEHAPVRECAGMSPEPKSAHERREGRAGALLGRLTGRVHRNVVLDRGCESDRTESAPRRRSGCLGRSRVPRARRGVPALRLACPRPVKADGPPERAFPVVSGLDWCYGPLMKQKQYSSASPEARKCSLSSMWLWPPTRDRNFRVPSITSSSKVPSR